MTQEELNGYIHPAVWAQLSTLALAAVLYICDKPRGAACVMAFSMGIGVGYLILRFIPFPGVTP